MGMDTDSLDFIAIRGIQAGSAYYVIMVPLKVVPELFIFDEGAMPPALRAQRTMNRARVPDIAAYSLHVTLSFGRREDGQTIQARQGLRTANWPHQAV